MPTGSPYTLNWRDRSCRILIYVLNHAEHLR